MFKISKIDKNLNYGKKFINYVSKILKKFNIKLTFNKIEEGNKRKDGYFTKVLITSIDDEMSKINLLGRIGYIYDYKKVNIARLAYHYMLLKQNQVKERNAK